MLTNIPSGDSSLSVEAVLAGCWSLAVTVSPVEPELEAEQEPGDLSSSGPGPGQMDSGEVGERNSSGIWRCFCILGALGLKLLGRRRRRKRLWRGVTGVRQL